MNLKILFLTTIITDNPKTGGEIVTFNITKALRDLGNTVKICGYSRLGERSASAQTGNIIVASTYIESLTSLKQTFFSLIRSFIKRKPYSCTKYISDKYITSVNEELRSKNYDLVIIDHAQMAWLAEENLCSPLVLIAHNVEHELYRKLYEETPLTEFWLKFVYLREYRLMYEMEERIFSKVDQIWTLSGLDRNNIQREFGIDNVQVLHIPGGFEKLIKSTDKKYSVAMIGTWTWNANKKGLDWFLERVMPFLNKDIDIHIAGIGADWIVGRYSNIVYHGYVNDAQEFLSGSKCIIVPSTSGSGIQIKTLDAISSGVPVVLTSIGVRGIEDLPSSAFIEDEPERFAKAVGNIVFNDFKDTSGYKWSFTRRKLFKKEIQSFIESVVD